MSSPSIVAVASPPGGTGKSTISVGLSLMLAEQGAKVLLVDLDQNNNATDWTLRLANSDEIDRRNLFHTLRGAVALPEAIMTSHMGFDVAPATPELYFLQREFRSQVETVSELETLEQQVRRDFMVELRVLPYDRIIIDAPPGLTFESALALACADLCLMPVRMNRKLLLAHDMLAEFSSVIRDSPLRILSVPNLVQSEQEEDALRMHATGIVAELAETTIRKNQSLADAMESGEPISKKAADARRRLTSLAGEVFKS